ncbi:MAG: PD-(D/E)XK nuclease family protein [Holosporales bacterium]|jgi:hypothetical protein|nr:PD-(D/E)XK nuclease family protein [Holosporales bacterium]
MCDVATFIASKLKDQKEYFDCIIITQTNGSVQRILESFVKFTEEKKSNCLIPEIISLEELGDNRLSSKPLLKPILDIHENSSIEATNKFAEEIELRENSNYPFEFWDVVKTVRNRISSVSFFDTLQFSNIVLENLGHCQKYSDSLENLPFFVCENNSTTKQLFEIIKEFWDKNPGIWKKIEEILQKKGKKFFFVDVTPNLYFPCIDRLRKKCEHITFKEHEAFYFYKEFQSPADEAAAIALKIEELIKQQNANIAIISDDTNIIERIKSELNILEIASKNYTTSNSINNTNYGTFIYEIADFIWNPCGKKLEILLCNQLIKKFASVDFKRKVKFFIQRIIQTHSEFVNNNFIAKNNATLPEFLDIINKHEDLQPLYEWIENLQEIVRVKDCVYFTDFVTVHEKAIADFIRVILKPVSSTEEESHPKQHFELGPEATHKLTEEIELRNKSNAFAFEEPNSKELNALFIFFEDLKSSQIFERISSDEYLCSIKFLLKKKKNDLSSQNKFSFECSKKNNILLLSTKSAMSFDFDVAFLPSMSEEIWYKELHFGYLLNQKYNLSIEKDVFKYIANKKNRKIYITRSLDKTTVRHSFLDALKFENFDDFFHFFEERGEKIFKKTKISAKASPPISSRPTKLSITNLQLLLDDPYSFYIKQILKLYPITFSENLDFGIWIHYILDQYFKQNCLQGNVALVDFAEKFAQTPYSHRFFLRAFAFLKELEKEFWEIKKKNIKILTELKCSINLNINNILFEVHGIIDRIDVLNKNDICIIDYKTGYVPSKKEIQECIKIQLPIEAKMYKSKNVIVRAVQLKTDIGRKNNIIIEISKDILRILDSKLKILLCNYKEKEYLFETISSNKLLHTEYRHLLRL